MGAVRQASQVVRFVWGHPGVRAHRMRALGRVALWQLWQRSVRQPLTIRMPGGMKLRCHPHSAIASGVIYVGLPEWQEMQFVRAHLRPGDVFVDVGANVGIYTLLAARAGARVIAFEPSSESFPRLQENVVANDLGTRVDARRLALGREPTAAVLTTGRDARNRLVPDGDNDANGDRGEPVDVVTLDESLALGDAARVALVKIDVEGAEVDVLLGSRDLLSHVRPALVVEANDRDELGRVLGSFGYGLFRFDVPTRSLVPLTPGAPPPRNLIAVHPDRRRLPVRSG